jgi:hypothetical protein
MCFVLLSQSTAINPLNIINWFGFVYPVRYELNFYVRRNLVSREQSIAGLRTKNGCSGEEQQQFIR